MRSAIELEMRNWIELEMSGELEMRGRIELEVSERCLAVVILYQDKIQTNLYHI